MKLAEYIKETKVELGHVNWPSRRSATLFTLIVVVISIAVAAYLGVFDYLFQILLEKFVLFR